MKNISHHEGRLGIFELAILPLTVLVLSALVIDTVAALPKGIAQILHWMDTAVCGIFLVDFGIRFYRAESKLVFMKWGWIDLVASIPNLDVLRWGRMVRVLRVIRLLRGVRSVHRVLRMVFEDRLEGGGVSMALVAFLLVTFSSVSVLVFEHEPGSNIKSAEDALWWSVATITTVGYGDKYPVTTEGRIIGVVLMVCGVGMYAGLSGLVASVFLGSHRKQSSEMAEILARLEQMQAQLDSNSRAQHIQAERNKAG